MAPLNSQVVKILRHFNGRRGLAALYGITALATLGVLTAPTDAPAATPAAQAPDPVNALLAKRPPIPAVTALGRAMFFDPSLSASGKQACASCHSPQHAYGPPDGHDVQLGGPSGKLAGTRAVPSIRYVQSVPTFTEHFHEGEDDSKDQGPTGGHTWDGRAASIHEQARLPLFSPVEMANRKPADVIAKVKRAPYAAQMREIFGADVFDDETRAMSAIVLALEVFQQSPSDFYPYTSKYDAVLRGQTRLSPQELRGFLLFNDPAKGNCASCHPSGMQEGGFPQFSDWGFIALGVPRNAKLPANHDPAHFDLGLCGPDRRDFAGRSDYCGLFRTPSLRNVAERRVFFHNGAFHRLEDVVSFYATRDTEPQRWYPRGKRGKTEKYDDLPARYRDNINTDPPFGGKAGDPPVLSKQEIADVVAFLKTLSDGYVLTGDKGKSSSRP
jgi:cytochrome c peroxidase